MSLGIMRHNPSGETYVMELNDDREGTIAWVAGPYPLVEIMAATDLANFQQDAHDDDIEWAETQQWTAVR